MVIHSKLVTYGLPLFIVLANLKKKNHLLVWSAMALQWHFNGTTMALPQHFHGTSPALPREFQGKQKV